MVENGSVGSYAIASAFFIIGTLFLIPSQGFSSWVASGGTLIIGGLAILPPIRWVLLVYTPVPANTIPVYVFAVGMAVLSYVLIPA